MPLVGALGASAVGSGLTALGSYFQNKEQKKLYNSTMKDIDAQYQKLGQQFQKNLANYKAQLQQQYPQRIAEIEKIYSMENPQIADYVNNLKQSYEETKESVYKSVKQANADELRRLHQQGVTTGTMGRMLAGNQMERVKQAEQALTAKMNEVLAPQAQIAQMGMQEKAGAHRDLASGMNWAGQQSVETPLGIGSSQIGAKTRIPQPGGTSALGNLFGGIGTSAVGRGIEGLFSQIPGLK